MVSLGKKKKKKSEDLSTWIHLLPRQPSARAGQNCLLQAGASSQAALHHGFASSCGPPGSRRTQSVWLRFQLRGRMTQNSWAPVPVPIQFLFPSIVFYLCFLPAQKLCWHPNYSLLHVVSWFPSCLLFPTPLPSSLLFQRGVVTESSALASIPKGYQELLLPSRCAFIRPPSPHSASPSACHPSAGAVAPDWCWHQPPSSLP